MKRIVITLALLGIVFASSAAPAGNTTDGIERGPYFTGTIKSGFPVANNLAMKGVVVSVGANRDVHVCYDTDLMRVSVAWAGDYLKFGKSQVEIVHPQPPEVLGKPLFGTQVGPGWAMAGQLDDGRTNKQGRLPTEWAKYRGLYLNGWNVVLKYTVGAAEVLEMPGVEKSARRMSSPAPSSWTARRRRRWSCATRCQRAARRARSSPSTCRSRGMNPRSRSPSRCRAAKASRSRTRTAVCSRRFLRASSLSASRSGRVRSRTSPPWKPR